MPAVSPTAVTVVSATTDGATLGFSYDLGTQALDSIVLHVPPVAVRVVTISVIDGPSGNPIIAPVAVNFLGMTVTVSGLGYELVTTGATPLLPRGQYYSGNRFVEFVLF